MEWLCRGDARIGLCFADPLRRLKRSRSDSWATQRPPFWICGVEYLGSHGIDAKSTIVSEQDQPDAAQCERSCLEHGADLVVMGAFTRPGAGIPVFGSMTGEMIQQVIWPVFMAH